MFISFSFFTGIRDAVPWRTRSWLVKLMLLMTLMIAVSGATAAATPASPDKTRQVQLEAELTGELQRVVNAQRRIEGQGRDVVVSVRFVRDDRQQLGLVIDLSEAYVPQGALYFGAEMEDLTSELANIASEFLRNIIVISGVDIRFGGKDIYDYFPAESRFALFSGRGASAPVTAATIVSAAGHGIYYHYGFKDWRAQRDPSNGITEDFITPDYATELSLWLEKRSDIAAKFPRSNTTAEHGPSGQPWDEIGARYNLQLIYPENPNLWHSLPDTTGNLRERNEDIRSRPLFANHIGADAIFHLHTNAADQAASGVRAIYHTGRSADQRLANNVLCYMKELIQAKEMYKNYPVPSQSEKRNNLGENRLATMPSVIIEAGFHTNPSDAAALKDPVFRTAAMKGVEKGYRLTAEDKGCEPFKIDRIPDTSGMQNTYIPVEVHYQGYPQFAVTAKVEVVSCPGGWTCSGGELEYPDHEDTPLVYEVMCNGIWWSPATFRFKTSLSDLDGVSPAAVEHTMTCLPPGIRGNSGTGGRPSISLRPQKAR
ncbi:N-acetylmuramoyl-L-alanine amidase [Collimonas fungivorans]|nr:N-acetylmuramoyl-L-alanine amidase [Collimonas fungivorans]